MRTVEGEASKVRVRPTAVLDEKRRALGASPSGRLRQAVPESEALLEEAFRRGESLGPASRQLLEFLDDYGAEELRQAIRLALDRATPRLSSVAYILQQRRRRKQLRILRPVQLERRPDLADLHVQPHDSDIYDELSNEAEDDDPRD